VSHVVGFGRDLTKEDYEETVVPLCEEYPTRFNSKKMSLELFRIAGSWVASRAFGVDSFHGIVLLPPDHLPESMLHG
jgi:hypothetical protein